MWKQKGNERDDLIPLENEIYIPETNILPDKYKNDKSRPAKYMQPVSDYEIGYQEGIKKALNEIKYLKDRIKNLETINNHINIERSKLISENKSVKQKYDDLIKNNVNRMKRSHRSKKCICETVGITEEEVMKILENLPNQ